MRKLNSLKTNKLGLLANNIYQMPGVGTLEIVIILAVLLAVALLFRTKISTFAESLFTKVFDEGFIGGLNKLKG